MMASLSTSATSYRVTYGASDLACLGEEYFRIQYSPSHTPDQASAMAFIAGDRMVARVLCNGGYDVYGHGHLEKMGTPWEKA
jgi:hypothetical protein